MNLRKAAVAALILLCSIGAALGQTQFPAKTVWGNPTASTGFPTTMTQAQITSLCNPFSASLLGCAPASGGGTVNFLRADGSWALPPGAITPGGTSGQVQTNNGAGGLAGITNTQLTALINLATASLPGALPAWPNNTTTFLRGDGSYTQVGNGALVNPATTVNGQTCALGASCVVPNQAIDVFLVIGDSNAVGLGTSAQSPTPPSTVLAYCANGTIVTASDPTCSAVATADNANTGSMWPALGIAYGRRIGFVLTGVSGSTQAAAADLHAGAGNWQDTAPGSNYANSLTAINAALTAYAQAGYSPVFRGIIYVLGNNDAAQIDAAVITVSQYTAAYTAMAANYRGATIGGAAYPKMPIFMPLIGTSTAASDVGYSQVRSAQLGISAADANTLVPFVDLASFNVRGLLSSGPHMTQAGYNQMGTQLGGSIIPFIQANVPFQVFNANAAVPPLPLTGTIVQTAGVDGVSPVILVDAFGSAAPSYVLRVASGTGASPTAVGSGAALGIIGTRGYGATGYGTHNTGGFLFNATQAWTDTAQGTSITWFCTANGAAVSATCLFIDQDKTVTMPAYETGIAHFNGSGKITSSAVSLTADVSGILPLANGGTGVTTGTGMMITAPITVDFSVAGDNAITVSLPPGFTQMGAVQAYISGANANISAATFGIFTTTGGGGSPIVSSAAAITVTSGTANTNNNFQQVNAVNVSTEAYTPSGGTVQFRVGSTTTGTAKVYMMYRPVP